MGKSLCHFPVNLPEADGGPAHQISEARALTWYKPLPKLHSALLTMLPALKMKCIPEA